MKLGIFAAYDAAVRAYLQPFFVRSKGEAIRSFTDAVNDEKGMFNRHAGDFALFALGEFDDGDGSVSTLSVPQRIVTAEDVLRVDDVFPPEKKIS